MPFLVVSPSNASFCSEKTLELNEQCETKESTIYLFDIKNNIKQGSYPAHNFNEFERRSSKDYSNSNIIFMEHKYFDYNDQNIDPKTITNSKISMKLTKDSESVRKESSKKEQNLTKTAKLILDPDSFAGLNQTLKKSFLFTFLKYPYCNFKDMRVDEFLQEVFQANQSPPVKYEIGLGNETDSGYELGLKHSQHNLKYEELAEYIPVFVETNKTMSNDQIVELIQSQVNAKLKQINEKFIRDLNLKFPIDYMCLKMRNFSTDVESYSELDSEYAKMFLVSYQTHDKNLNSLPPEIIKEEVQVKSAILVDTSKERIKLAIDECIGDKEETYPCNYFKLYSFAILIKTPKAKLVKLLRNADLMEHVELINDPDFDSDNQDIFKTIELSSNNENYVIQDQVSQVGKGLRQANSSRFEQENFNLKQSKPVNTPKLTKSKTFITTPDEPKKSPKDQAEDETDSTKTVFNNSREKFEVLRSKFEKK